MALSNSISRPGITEISARSITMASDSSSGNAPARAVEVASVCPPAGGDGQALLRQFSELEFLRSAGRSQRQLFGGQEHHVPRHFETGEPGCAKLDQLLRVGQDVAGGQYASAADFAHLHVRKSDDEGLADQRMLVQQFLDLTGHDHFSAATVSFL